MATGSSNKASEEQWYDATVPGCVHTDMMANKLIEDPFYRDNETKIQWIENEDWEYEMDFDVPPTLLGKDRVEITFEGLDTYADIYLNEALLQSADNMFRTWTVDVTGSLKSGSNSLRVYFHSPITDTQKRYEALDYDLPGGNRAMTRKAAFHYGWDWGPRFVTSGIWRPVKLTGWNRAKISNLQIVQRDVSSDVAKLTVVFEVEALKESEGIVSIEMGDVEAAQKVKLQPGKNVDSIDFEINDPKLWWSNGLGEANLYDLLGTLELNGAITDTIKDRIGIRTIKLLDVRDEIGRSFTFELNGQQIYMKGANYIPQNIFQSNVTDDHYEKLISDAAEANMNMLRVWGGGIYENDIFYDLCDENGILVWQDFMFANTMYPGDEDFMDNSRAEAIENIKRLRNHPCIALWCGNNEIEEGWQNWGWQDNYTYEQKKKIWKDYRQLFYFDFGDIVEESGGGVPFWSSSPQFGRGNPKSNSEGDSHYWGVWHDAEPFEKYLQNIPRFMSEFGFQSYPGITTIEGFALEEEQALGSDVMKVHQKHSRGDELIDEYMNREFIVPEEFESYVYVSQLLQAEGIGGGIEGQRRYKPACMGSLYWQLNDCWPAVSWSSIDYNGDWKALHYFVKRAFAPVLVSLMKYNTEMYVQVCSDRLINFDAELELALIDFDGNQLFHHKKPVNVRGNNADVYYETDMRDILKAHNTREVVLTMKLTEAGNTLSENLFYFRDFKDLNLSTPTIKKRIKKSDAGYQITLNSDRLAKGVFLRIDNKGHFTDNYFDLLPGIDKTVIFETKEDVDMEGGLIIRSLVDTYSER